MKFKELLVCGSRIKAGNDVALHADSALQLDAQANTATQTSSNHSSSASIGLTASMGAKGMQLGVTVAQIADWGQVLKSSFSSYS